jgi:hypothetical protein
MIVMQNKKGKGGTGRGSNQGFSAFHPFYRGAVVEW